MTWFSLLSSICSCCHCRHLSLVTLFPLLWLSLYPNHKPKQHVIMKNAQTLYLINFSDLYCTYIATDKIWSICSVAIVVSTSVAIVISISVPVVMTYCNSAQCQENENSWNSKVERKEIWSFGQEIWNSVSVCPFLTSGHTKLSEMPHRGIMIMYKTWILRH